MTLIQSISGIRGTIGGVPGEGLSPVDIVKFSSAYGTWVKQQFSQQRLQVVIGRDSRISGPMVSSFVASTLQALGIDVIDAGLSTTPTVEMGVLHHRAQGGIIITASHNPGNWNALKLLNHRGEFLNQNEIDELAACMDGQPVQYAPSDKLGNYMQNETLMEVHLEKILDLPLVDVEAVSKANFHVVVDGINSSGGIAVPLLLRAMGVKRITELNCEPNGLFQHNPEPLPEHLGHLAAEVKKSDADLGIAVDPDVDRLAIVCEDGEMFGEEYSLVSVADYVLRHEPGSTVSNMSSTQALAEISAKYGQKHFYSPVGEAHVVEVMKREQAVIGGEGNGGVIYPALHCGRDALVGIALFMTNLAKSAVSCSRLKAQYPFYHISKNKVELPRDTDLNKVLDILAENYKNQQPQRMDGLKISFGKEWVHLRKSNTEPVIRLYAESDSNVKAENMVNKLRNDIREALKEL